MAHLLIVEDDLYNLELAAQWFQSKGYEVTSCPSLYEAYNQLAPSQGDKSNPYDAIISDFNLGGRKETGLEVYQFANATFGSLAMCHFIGTSSEIEKWQKIVDIFMTDEDFARKPTIHAIPKRNDAGWDTPALLAKLHELGINP